MIKLLSPSNRRKIRIFTKAAATNHLFNLNLKEGREKGMKRSSILIFPRNSWITLILSSSVEHHRFSIFIAEFPATVAAVPNAEHTAPDERESLEQHDKLQSRGHAHRGGGRGGRVHLRLPPGEAEHRWKPRLRLLRRRSHLRGRQVSRLRRSFPEHGQRPGDR